MGTPDHASLGELEQETRILLPGTQVFLGFLVTLPFTQRFDALQDGQRTVYLATFASTLVAMTCFMAPSAYHRIARPIHDKERFKRFANTLLIVGIAPASASFVLVTYLVCSMVRPGVAVPAACVVGFLVVALWWVVPLLRVHDRFSPSKERAGHAAE